MSIFIAKFSNGRVALDSVKYLSISRTCFNFLPENSIFFIYFLIWNTDYLWTKNNFKEIVRVNLLLFGEILLKKIYDNKDIFHRFKIIIIIKFTHFIQVKFKNLWLIVYLFQVLDISST